MNDKTKTGILKIQALGKEVGFMVTPTPSETPNSSKLEEAKELLENYKFGLSTYVGKLLELSHLIKHLLTAQDLLSCERGREDQRKEDAEIINSFSIPEDYFEVFPNSIMDVRSFRSSFLQGWETARNYNNNVVKKTMQEAILNPEAQQALKSDNQNPDAK